MVYGRAYDGRELRFEPSGGLIHASLVMQDKETDSYWPIMSGSAVAGELEGTRLEELPVGEKIQWKDWVAAHPDTVVLSVDGVEHEPVNPYENYFGSDSSYRGMHATDDRLPTKALIYAFHLEGRAYAVPFDAYAGGARFAIGDRTVFLYRPSEAELFHSSVAFISSGSFERGDGVWRAAGGARFDPRAESFVGEAHDVRRLDGFDTFWFNWSMSNPDTLILGK